MTWEHAPVNRLDEIVFPFLQFADRDTWSAEDGLHATQSKDLPGTPEDEEQDIHQGWLVTAMPGSGKVGIVVNKVDANGGYDGQCEMTIDQWIELRTVVDQAFDYIGSVDAGNNKA